MPSWDPTPSSKLRSGRSPRPYGSFPRNHSTQSNGSSDGLPPYAPNPHPTGRTFTERTSIIIIISRGLTISLVAIILFQSVLIICRSDALAKYVDLDSAASRASREKSALVVEREKSEQERAKSEQERKRWGWERGEWELDKGKWELDKERWESDKGKWESERGEWKSERENLEQERENLRLERERWERAREDRVPQGSFWEIVRPTPECLAYGKREYWGILQNIPEDWTTVEACMNMPVEIKGVTVRRPDRCAFVEGSPHIHGYWMVDWDQPDCRPWFREFHDAGCTSHGSGQRRIEAHLVGLNNRKEQDWWLLCSSTPMVWNQITYTSPTHCQERRGGRKVAMWDVPDGRCL